MDRIEKLVRARRTEAARKQILLYLKEHPGLASEITACDWYRRLGLFRAGYLLIAPKVWRSHQESTATEEGRRLLWCARLLNLMGATAYALQIAGRLRCESAEDLRVQGDIFLSAYEFEKAAVALTQADEVETNRSSYAARLGVIALCDSLSALGRGTEAIQKLSAIKVTQDENLLQGIVLQATGEYLAELGRFPEALRKLESAQGHFPEGESGTDHALLWKWLAYVKARLGQEAEAKVLFKKALKVLQAPDLRSEAALEAGWLLHKLGWLPKKEIPGLSAYPGLSRYFLKRAGMPPPPFLPAKKGSEKVRILSARNEWALGGTPRFGIPKEVLLLSLLKRAGPRGISLTRFKPLLWPEDVASFPALELRIYKLLGRLQVKFKMRAQVRDGVVVLDPKALAQVAVEVAHEPLRPTLYERSPTFLAKEFAAYYGLGKTQASIHLKEEIRKGALLPEEADGEVRYRSAVQSGLA